MTHAMTPLSQRWTTLKERCNETGTCRRVYMRRSPSVRRPEPPFYFKPPRFPRLLPNGPKKGLCRAKEGRGVWCIGGTRVGGFPMVLHIVANV